MKNYKIEESTVFAFDYYNNYTETLKLLVDKFQLDFNKNLYG